MRATLAALLLPIVLGACAKRSSTDQGSAPSPAFSAPKSAPPPAAVDATAAVTVEIPEVPVRPGALTTVKVTWLTQKGTTVNDEAPFRVRWNRSDGLVEAPADLRATGAAVKEGFRVNVRPMAGAPNATIHGEIDIVVCDETTHSICLPVRRSVELGFVVTKDAVDPATVSIPLPDARPPK